MNEVNPNNYTNGGNAGGIANITLIASEVPIGEKDNVIAAYGEILSDFAENGICQGFFLQKRTYLLRRTRRRFFTKAVLLIFSCFIMLF